MAFRFVICLGASRLYRVSRQGLSSGTASRWLADDEALVVTSPVPSDLVEGIDVLGTACPGSFDNPVFDPHNERPRSGPAGSRVPGSSWDDSDVMYRVKAPGARQILRAYLRDPAVQLGLLVLALGAGCLTFYGVGYGPASGGAPFKVVARVLGGLTFLAVIPFLYTLWRWFGDKKYQAGPTNVRL
ncbi:hypothetical protein CSUI_009709 [Cystoisospora suis]|uniref:Transmembrane protein n=1 Tax=Cystoisospora suis TaxID=483139 RepID=A0A2C6KJ86_9APIC|nr:hypothetical protein CSUI_009709 [Cystoisospora suis]